MSIQVEYSFHHNEIKSVEGQVATGEGPAEKKEDERGRRKGREGFRGAEAKAGKRGKGIGW
jgi:hypothetical protein